MREYKNIQQSCVECKNNANEICKEKISENIQGFAFPFPSSCDHPTTVHFVVLKYTSSRKIIKSKSHTKHCF